MNIAKNSFLKNGFLYRTPLVSVSDHKVLGPGTLQILLPMQNLNIRCERLTSTRFNDALTPHF